MSAPGVGVVLVAAGQGTRLGADRPKALVPLLGTPVVTHALRRALQTAGLTHVTVVAPPGHQDEIGAAVAPLSGTSAIPVHVVAGGAERTDSVAAGLAALPGEVQIVLVHDAARPLAPPELFDRVAQAVAAGREAVVPALPVTDTIKQVNARGGVVATPDRAALRAVQTPQGFRRQVLERAHRASWSTASDDAALVERTGGTVHVVGGDVLAAKVTGPDDLESLARALRATRPPLLLVLGGPPGVGKTDLAQEWVRRRRAVHLRIDSLEQALVRGGVREVGSQGYAVAHAVAADQLVLGLGVVADAVHPVGESRAAWPTLAERAGVRHLAVELRCEDAGEHRRRVEERRADIEGHRLPDWSSVTGLGWEAWPEADLVLDTGLLDVAALADLIEAHLEEPL